MQPGLILLCLAYVLSQFFRAFLAVLADILEHDIGTTPEDLAFASGLWFLSFAALQLPVGWALDRIGPRLTSSILLLVGGAGGAALFALATTPAHINAAMLLIGIGCSPVLMASYYIFALEYPPAKFAMLAALMLGVGSAGNLAASYPTALAADIIGWRGTLAGLAIISGLVAVGLFFTVRDPAPVAGGPKGSLFDLLKMPVIWAILPLMLVNYAPSAAVRGLWIGPYLSDMFGLSTAQIGQATLAMGFAMITGTLCYGPLDRILRTRKWLVIGGGFLCVLTLLALIALPANNVFVAIGLFACLGFLGGSFPVMIAHGRSFFPPHLVGRGVTLMNLFGIGGIGIMQIMSGRIAEQMADGPPTASYQAIFGLFAAALFVGLVIYLFSRDSLD